MSLVEKYALLPDEIDRRSIEVVEASLPKLDGLTAEERYVVCRIVRAEGDPEIAKSVGFSPGAVERGIAAIAANAAVVTDVRMVEVGGPAELQVARDLFRLSEEGPKSPD